MNIQKRENFRVHTSSCNPQKCAIKMKKGCVCKNVFDGRKQFISHIKRTGENDLNELRYSRYLCKLHSISLARYGGVLHLFETIVLAKL